MPNFFRKTENFSGKNGINGSERLVSMADQKIPYPKRVFFIIGNEFCERFNYYGMCSEFVVDTMFMIEAFNYIQWYCSLFKAILVLYLKYKLNYTENDATILFHGFLMVNFAMCFFGGVISDVWLGKFRTILYLSIVYSIGCLIIAISSIKILNLLPNISLMIGLILISIGSGGKLRDFRHNLDYLIIFETFPGIKPCVSTFGGDQFKMPEQAKQMTSFFSLFICQSMLVRCLQLWSHRSSEKMCIASAKMIAFHWPLECPPFSCLYQLVSSSITRFE